MESFKEDTVLVLNSLAQIYQEKRDYEKAKALFTRLTD